MLKDPAERLRSAIKDDNLYVVRRIVERSREIQTDAAPRRQKPFFNLDIRNTDPGPSRYTSLAWAAVHGHEEIFEYLLNMGHDEEELSRDAENNTILILLAGVRNSPVLSAAGREYDLQDTALRMARMYYERYPYLIDWSNVHLKTALHVASTKGNEGFVRMFCDLGADFDLPDIKGNTPLHYASAWNHVSVIQLLIERGCQFAARNNDGFTASDYAFSFSTMNTLEETARAQFENNKRARRHIYAQAAQRGSEREREHGVMNTRDGASIEDSGRRNGRMANDDFPRQRSGSGGAKVGSGSSDGIKASGSSVTSHPIISQRGPKQQIPFAASSSQSDRPTVLQPVPLSRTANAPPSGPGSIQPSTSTESNLTPLVPPVNGAGGKHAISPIASRMRDRDADAMAEYMKRTRSGSNSTSTPDIRPSANILPAVGDNGGASPRLTPSGGPQDTRLPQPLPEPNVEDAGPAERDLETEKSRPPALRPLRRLRPSNSATSLRPTGIIGLPTVASHGHSNSAMELDLINEVFRGLDNQPESFLPSLSPINTSPTSLVLPSTMEPTRPLDFKPRSRDPVHRGDMAKERP